MSYRSSNVTTNEIYKGQLTSTTTSQQREIILYI